MKHLLHLLYQLETDNCKLAKKRGIPSLYQRAAAHVGMSTVGMAMKTHNS